MSAYLEKEEEQARRSLAFEGEFAREQELQSWWKLSQCVWRTTKADLAEDERVEKKVNRDEVRES